MKTSLEAVTREGYGLVGQWQSRQLDDVTLMVFRYHGLSESGQTGREGQGS